MESFEIKCTLREGVGKKASKNLRRKGGIPCVLYGGKKNIHFTALTNDFRHLIYTPHVYIVKLDIEGKPFTATMQDIQFHPVSDKVIHIDFLQVVEDKKVIIDIPVKLLGVSPGVKEGGQLKLDARKLKIRGLVKNLPNTIDISIENLALGKTIKVSDVKLENLEVLNPKNNVVVSVKLTRVARGLEAAGAAGEGEADTEKAEA